jgi:hypothetical protein
LKPQEDAPEQAEDPEEEKKSEEDNILTSI